MNFKLVLNEKELNVILASLQELQYKTVAPVIETLKTQINANYEELRNEEARKEEAQQEKTEQEKEEMVHEMDHMFNGDKEGDKE